MSNPEKEAMEAICKLGGFSTQSELAELVGESLRLAFERGIAAQLPPREQITNECASCGHVATREETEDEYRARLGLPPLDGNH